MAELHFGHGFLRSDVTFCIKSFPPRHSMCSGSVCQGFSTCKYRWHKLFTEVEKTFNSPSVIVRHSRLASLRKISQAPNFRPRNGYQTSCFQARSGQHQQFKRCLSMGFGGSRCAVLCRHSAVPVCRSMARQQVGYRTVLHARRCSAGRWRCFLVRLSAVDGQSARLRWLNFPEVQQVLRSLQVASAG